MPESQGIVFRVLSVIGRYLDNVFGEPRFSQIDFTRKVNEGRWGYMFLDDYALNGDGFQNLKSTEEYERDADYLIPNHPDI